MAKWGDFETHPVGTAKRIEKLEAKLAKAVEAMEFWSQAQGLELNEAADRIQTTLAELKGQDDDHFTG